MFYASRYLYDICLLGVMLCSSLGCAAYSPGRRPGGEPVLVERASRRGGGGRLRASKWRGLPVVVIDSSDDSGSSSSSDVSGSTMGEEQHDAEVRFPSCPCNCGSVHVLNKV